MKWKVAFVVGSILVLAVGFIFMWPATKQNMQMNNRTCPVSGNPVNDRDTYVHEGKEYKLCSDKCKESLSKDPDKYLSQ